MSLILSGTDGLSDVDGSASTPAIRGTDANTGIFFPAADTIAFAEGGVESMRIDSAGNVGIGTTSPSSGISSTQTVLEIANSNVAALALNNTAGKKYTMFSNVGSALVFYDVTSAAERMRIDSSGNVLVNTTSLNSGKVNIVASGSAQPCMIWNDSDATSGSQGIVSIRRNGSAVGLISTTNTNTTYATSSDYRLKENIAPMTGALATVSALKPVTYKWKSTGEESQGFIAHELQSVVPDCVTGQKDAVETYTDEDGNEQTRIKPQGVDTSFLVATLTAAIQELNEKVEAQAVRIAELEGAK